MIDFDLGSDESNYSERLARLLRPELDEVLGARGIDLQELTISSLDLDNLTLMSCGEEIRIVIVGITKRCKA